jgi:hypothetical protein
MTKDNTSNENSGLIAFVFIFIILLLQTGYFSIIIISKCDYSAVRVYTGFVGIGLAVFPLFVRRVIVNNNESSFRYKHGDDGRTKQRQGGIGLTINLIIMLVTPWVLWFLKRGDDLSFAESVTPSAIMQVSTGALGFFIAGSIAFVRDFKTAGRGFNIFKAVLLGSLIVYAFYISLPGLVHFGNWVSVITGWDTGAFSGILSSDTFWRYISNTIGSDALHWTIGFFISLYANIMIYRDGFLRQQKEY